MIVRFKDGLLVMTAETPEEEAARVAWAAAHEGHVFRLQAQETRTVLFKDLGREPDACRVPLNITSRIGDPALRLVSNLAPTPFTIDGEAYGSVEAFWQGLKFADPAKRAEIAPLHGHLARNAGLEALESDVITFGGAAVRVGTCDHWHLMERACRAKFTQHAGACAALLSTGERPLMHRTRRDSRTIPGVVMADIWMRIRDGLTVAKGGNL